MTDELPEPHPELRDPDWQRHAEKEAWVDYRRDRRRARRARRLTIAAAVLVVLVGGGYALVEWGKTTADHYDGASTGAAAVTTTTPTDLPDFGRVDLSRPFDNTPAQNWAEGIAGLSTPAPAKTGAFSAQQVSSAIDSVKQLITLGFLDRDTLETTPTSTSPCCRKTCAISSRRTSGTPTARRPT
ncbi:hypothetical protein [Amycolatopsis sp.]|uniref:hypothetical protein n=1 Tax=Amycolatopsis sp. TaxID=37632 RepID=UPI002C50C684|nr:hypothetical protein [Amycolatopsis sp.]HVV11958.1 hypothetical protein [Amycolatopsis sp.]